MRLFEPQPVFEIQIAQTKQAKKTNVHELWNKTAAAPVYKNASTFSGDAGNPHQFRAALPNGTRGCGEAVNVTANKESKDVREEKR